MLWKWSVVVMMEIVLGRVMMLIQHEHDDGWDVEDIDENSTRVLRR